MKSFHIGQSHLAAYRRSLKCRPLTILALLIATSFMSFASDVPDIEMITFKLQNVPPSSFLQARSSSASVSLAQDIFQANLRIPPASGKLPAVVLIHTCHGEAQYLPWINRFNNWGWATLSFSRCQPPAYTPDSTEFPSLDWWRGVPAANGALEYLGKRPEINSDAVVLIAWSRLGIVPLSALNPEGFSQFTSNRFTAAIAFYPFCSFARGPHDRPILVLTAENDDWVDNHVCQRMARASLNDPYPVRVEVLPNAVHGFDIEAYGPPHFASRAEINPDEFPAGGGTLGYNAMANQISIELVRDFLQQTVLH